MKYASICIILFFMVFMNYSQEKSLAYQEQEVNFRVYDIILSGTLTIPNSIGPHPAVILISGSYADNRNAELYGFKPFKLIAEHLSKKGYTVLRYDDRGVGKSTGKITYQYTVFELADDIFSAIKFLKARSDIRADRIGLIGHSLGGTLAYTVASRLKDVAFIVSLAGPVTKTDEINFKYRKSLLTKQGLPKQKIDKMLEIERRIITVNRTGKGLEKLVHDMKRIKKPDYENLNEKQKRRYKNFEDYFKSTWFGIMIPFINTPFMKSFWDFKPKPELETMTCPALFLFAEKDGQIKIEESAPIIVKALAKARNFNYTIRVLPKAGHYFADWQKKEFVPGFLNILTSWINEQR